MGTGGGWRKKGGGGWEYFPLGVKFQNKPKIRGGDGGLWWLRW